MTQVLRACIHYGYFMCLLLLCVHIQESSSSSGTSKNSLMAYNLVTCWQLPKSPLRL
jgi:hypothetical protein